MKKKKTRKWIAVTAVVIFALCLIPIKQAYKDGGTVAYNAILYSYIKHHRLEPDGTYDIRNEFLVFPFNYLTFYGRR